MTARDGAYRHRCAGLRPIAVIKSPSLTEPLLAQIAFIVAFGVLLDTLVVRSLLVPALAYDIGPRVWWPSRLAREELRAQAPGAPPASDATAASRVDA